MHIEIKGGALRAFAASKLLLQKVGVAHEATIAVAVVVLLDRAFLIMHLK